MTNMLLHHNMDLVACAAVDVHTLRGHHTEHASKHQHKFNAQLTCAGLDPFNWQLCGLILAALSLALH